MPGGATAVVDARRFRPLVEHLRDEILVLDAEFRPLYATPSARRAAPRALERALPVDPLDDIHPDDRASALALRKELLARPGVPLVFRLRLARGDGSWRWVEGVATNLLESAIGGIVVNRRDVTESRQSREERPLLAAEVEQAHRLEAVALLTSKVAHDLNNILFAIAGYSELLADESTTSAGRRESAEHLEEVIGQARSLVAELLELGRPGNGRAQLLDLNQVLRDLEPLAALLAGPAVELLLTPGEEPLPIVCRRRGLEQAIINLVLNARDAMPDGGRLELATSIGDFPEPIDHDRGAVSGGRHATLTVCDTGVGMDAATRRRIFEPFFTTKGAARGTGLGLAIVDDVVTAAGGSIQVESRQGEGTRFDLHLPLAPGA